MTKPVKFSAGCWEAVSADVPTLTEDGYAGALLRDMVTREVIGLRIYTRPQPEAVEGEGMETVAWRYDQTDINGDAWPWEYTENGNWAASRARGNYHVEPLVRRSDAERLLSQKDAEIRDLAHDLERAQAAVVAESEARAAAEARIAELEGALVRDLGVTDGELLRLRNFAVGHERITVSVRMFQTLVDAVRRARALLSPETKE